MADGKVNPTVLKLRLLLYRIVLHGRARLRPNRKTRSGSSFYNAAFGYFVLSQQERLSENYFTPHRKAKISRRDLTTQPRISEAPSWVCNVTPNNT
ncbi:MAG TPA: hypothetical protein PLI09_19750, partial [Candidatus Hydrogenedentes bacterium]|nr:hypothetical protein [Candidatus Hydrogenedentota bacterium]